MNDEVGHGHRRKRAEQKIPGRKQEARKRRAILSKR